MNWFRFIAIVQVICLLPIAIRFLFFSPEFSDVGLWFFAIGVSLLTVPVAVWHFVRHPARRSWSAVMIFLALLVVVAPMLMAQLDLDPLPRAPAALAGLLLIVVGTIWLLARPGLWSKEGWAVGRINTVLLIGEVLWIVLVAAPMIFGLLVGFTPPLGNDRQGLSLDALLIHAASLGLSGLLLAVFALLFSLAGLWRNRGQVWLHAAQFIAALVLTGILFVEAAILSIMMVNPG